MGIFDSENDIDDIEAVLRTLTSIEDRTGALEAPLENPDC